MEKSNQIGKLSISACKLHSGKGMFIPSHAWRRGVVLETSLLIAVGGFESLWRLVRRSL